MPVVLGLAAALAYGSADFVGGFVSRRNGAVTVVLLSQIFGALLMAPVMAFIIDTAPSGREIYYGLASGVAGAAGVILLFRGMTIGSMSVIAPVTGIVAPVVPVIVGIVQGERPGPLGTAGVVLALVAVGLISRGTPDPEQPALDAARDPRFFPAGIVEGLGAGFLFGVFFVLLERAGAGDSLSAWPLVWARLASISLVGLLALVTRPDLRPAPGTGRGILASGVLDVAANTFYYLAASLGLLSLSAVLTSMYPGVTVLLARTFLKERLRPSQVVGLFLGAVGVALITGAA